MKTAILGVPTSITAFVGRTARGDVSAPVRCLDFAEFELRCGGRWIESDLGYSVQHFFQNGGREALVCRVAAGARVATLDLATAGLPLRLEAANPGSWGNSLRATVSHISGHFNLTITEVDAQGVVVTREIFERVSVCPTDARHVERILACDSTLARVIACPIENPLENCDALFRGGTDGESAGVEDYELAITRLGGVETFNMLVISPPSRGDDTEFDLLNLQTMAVDFCEQMHAILLVDPPDTWSKVGDVDMEALDILRVANTAVYYPRIICVDPLRGNLRRAFAPSGMVAGVIARTDTGKGVWTAPAGPDACLIGAVDLELRLDPAQRGQLEALGVNALAWASNKATIMTARTGCGTQYATSMVELSVRRTIWFVLDSIERGTRWVEFAPGDDESCNRLQQGIEAFLADLFARGAFRGERASEALQIECTFATDGPSGPFILVEIGFVLATGEVIRTRYQQPVGRTGERESP